MSKYIIVGSAGFIVGVNVSAYLWKKEYKKLLDAANSLKQTVELQSLSAGLNETVLKLRDNQIAMLIRSGDRKSAIKMLTGEEDPLV